MIYRSIVVLLYLEGIQINWPNYREFLQNSLWSFDSLFFLSLKHISRFWKSGFICAVMEVPKSDCRLDENKTGVQKVHPQNRVGKRKRAASALIMKSYLNCSKQSWFLWTEARMQWLAPPTVSRVTGGQRVTNGSSTSEERVRISHDHQVTPVLISHYRRVSGPNLALRHTAGSILFYYYFNLPNYTFGLSCSAGT